MVQTPHCSLDLSLYVSQARAGAKFGAWLDRDQPSTKLKSANIFLHTGCGQSANFNSCQIFWLYVQYNTIVKVIAEG